MASLEIATKMLIMLISTLCGFTISHIKSLQKFVDLINIYLFYVATPITIFIKVSTASSEIEFVAMLAISLLHIALVFIATFAVAKAIHRDFDDALSLAISISMPNAGFLAIPLAIMLFGDSLGVIPYTIAFNIALPLFAFVLARISAVRSGNRKIYVKVVPILLALLVGIAHRLAEPRLHIHIESYLQLADTIVSSSFYSSFIVLGATFAMLSLYDLRSYGTVLKISIPLKYIASPILAIVLIHVFTRYFSISTPFLQGILLQSIMPPAVLNLILARAFKLNEKMVSLLVTLLTVLSIILSLAIPALNLF
jgi:predicted permease